MSSLGALIPRMLVERGVDVVFGIPGVHTVEMYRGMPGAGLRHVTPRHEQGAGFMADGHWRATGRVAACFIITGPGMTNIATAMGQAYGDSVPMIVISSVNQEAHIGRGTGRLHELQDQSALAAGVAAWSRTVRDAASFADALDDALDLFESDRPRPVHIQIPLDRLSADAGARPEPRARKAKREAAADEVTRAAEILNDATRPALALGGGAVELGEDARRLAEALGAATFMTSNARGLLPPDHPLNAGGMLFAPPQRALLGEADAVLAIGCEFGETDWTFYADEPLRFGGPLIRVDVDEAQLTRNVEPDLGVVADGSAFASALLCELRTGRAAPDLAERADLAPHLDARLARHVPLLEAIWRAHPDAVIVGDSTEPAYAGLVAARPPGPRQWFTGATGFGTLGFALPAAIGAKVAAPDRPVVALVGDGGALYTIAELAAAVETKTPVAMVVWNNDGYGEIREYMRANQIRPEGVDLSPVDFEALSRGFGAEYARARDMTDVTAAIAVACEGETPVVIEIVEREWRSA